MISHNEMFSKFSRHTEIPGLWTQVFDAVPWKQVFDAQLWALISGRWTLDSGQ